MMGKKAHVLVVPYPAQGHVTPLLKLSHRIADYGVKVTFVNTEFVHAKIMATMPDHNNEEEEEEQQQNQVGLVSIPDGLEPNDDRRDALKLLESIRRVMPGHLKDLIEKIGHTEKIRCVIADPTLGWILEVAKEMGIEQAAMWPAGTRGLPLFPHIPKLIESGVMDMSGAILRNELINVSKDIRAFSTSELDWNCIDDPIIQKICFECALTIKQTLEHSNWFLCNTIYELDLPVCRLFPNILPVGPLLASDHPRHSSGSFSLQDSTCLRWLNEQPAGSVVYVAFGSTTVFSQHQFHELALGLELAGWPFLWIVRPGLTNRSFAEYPDGFAEKVAGRGKIVEWAPQEKLLGQSAIACFMTHCGWNSTMEGVSNGVPFLCWPYFGDQFHNRSSICDVWKVGLRLEHDENKIVSRHEIKKKIENLLSDDDIKANSLKLKEIARNSIEKGGSSCKNFERFVQHLKQ
ncbi:hypothetical protein HYC85_004914 [Camellia sinensis]|uniref:Glycosyltransferase N-terminal domain-containing protein n=1 Tax=Camellia sinensis TaxID=4442 RepID=A0A7J7HYG5_CAMSI|nr:hypothetical protein HYC85_004914 [Camellia sinensis]